ncbi:MAG TPA: SDR family NAD(P)-dependent oxidoreductase [Kofleriaceae bacterium]|nr:SDR family NAD(P)-dependent oxidoreductase [Kofleriaceae bacterium]
MKLSGNTILITGGSRGIGLAFAKKLVELDNEVIITGRNQAALDAAAKEHPKLKTICSDAGSAKAITELAREMKEKYPKLNVLFNNAGVMSYRRLAAPEGLDALTSEIDINLSGPIRLVSAMIEQLKANKGTIINVSSGLAFVPLPASPIYCATKAAMHSYTLSLRSQLAEHGVEVIELMPPAVKTELAPIADDGRVKYITTDELVDTTMKALAKGKLEIRPGQANQLRFMSRWAPNFIQGQLAKATKDLIPPGPGDGR